MKKPKVVILNITHGDNPYMDKSPFLPIAAGACRNDITNDACGEDNISAKNKWYGDFTSIYWAWKNLKDVDIIGTSHYRRYILNIDNPAKHLYYQTWKNFCNEEYNISSFQQDLQCVDFILSYPKNFQETLYEQYVFDHPYPENIELVSKILKEIHPESVPAWDIYMKGHTLRYGFLFITTWHNFDELCAWLYPILQRCEEVLDLSSFTGYQERVIAYLYERLVPVFIDTYGKRVKYYPMCFITTDSPEIYYQRDENEQLYLTYMRLYENIRKSKAYRIGKTLLKPFKWLKGK